MEMLLKSVELSVGYFLALLSSTLDAFLHIEVLNFLNIAFSYAKPPFLTHEEDIIVFPHLSFGFFTEQGTCLWSYRP